MDVSWELHERSVILQRESQKLRIENLGEELAALVQGTRDEPDFLSPWVKEEPVRCKSRMWARLPGLELKYWGLECIGRIMGGIGRVVEADIGTACRNGFRFARVLMEVEQGQECPDFVGFEGEKGEEVVQRIEYEEGRGLVNVFGSRRLMENDDDELMMMNEITIVQS